MLECKDLSVSPAAYELVSALHSSIFINWLEQLTGIQNIIPDPHLIGAGYSKNFNGDALKTHVDFNWNDRLKLHRALSLIIYLTPGWESNWGGSLNFYDFDRETIIKCVDCAFNKAVIWKYHKKGFHGYNNPIQCPNDMFRSTFRLFYYTSNSTYNPVDPPHRSLYWFNATTKEPYDLKDKK
jgi:Rps23 Pro-64 3,4-dihydroxylase Tpa1-like proline 4-hydroxylase